MDWFAVAIIILQLINGGLTFVLKNSAECTIKNLFDKDLECYKKELEKTAFEYQTRFSSLHARRAKVIENLYYRIHNMQKELRRYYLNSHADQLYEPASQSVFDTYDYYEKHKIYFNNVLCSKIEEMLNVYGRGFAFTKQAAQNDSLDSKKVFREQSYKTVEETIPELKKAIEVEFQKLLGVS